MDEIKVTVEQIVIGKYDCDCMYTSIDKQSIQICFDKKDNISQYNGKEITLVKTNGIYTIKTDTSKK